MILFKESCGGCGEIRSDRRCFGCHHEAIDWGKKVEPPKTITLDEVIQLCQKIADKQLDDGEYRGALACVIALEAKYDC